MGLPTLFWRNQCVSFSIQAGGSKYASVSDATSVATQAFNAWSSAQCPGGGTPSIFPSSFPPVQCNAVPSQAHNNPIIFRDNMWPYDDSANAIGYTTLTVNLDTGEILGAAVEINTAYYHVVVNGAPGPGEYDLATILTHEAGHFLGLAHSGDPNAVMYALYKAGSTTLTPDDVAGICGIYSPDGSRMTVSGPVSATTCHPEPLNGFLPECGSLDAGALSSVASGPEMSIPADGGAMPCSTDSTSCSIGRGAGSRGGGLGAPFALVAVGALVRRARRANKRRGAALALVLALGWLGADATFARDAKASVSVTALFGELVEKSNAVAVITPLEQTAGWEDGRIATYTRARVDRLVAGKLGSEVWVRTIGGHVGRIAQIVEGEPAFALGMPSLVFLRSHLDPITGQPAGIFGVAEGAQGQFPIAGGEGRQRLTLARDVGALVPPHPASAGNDARPARDVLADRALGDAAGEIAAVWTLTHAR